MEDLRKKLFRERRNLIKYGLILMALGGINYASFNFFRFFRRESEQTDTIAIEKTTPNISDLIKEGKSWTRLYTLNEIGQFWKKGEEEKRRGTLPTPDEIYLSHEEADRFKEPLATHYGLVVTEIIGASARAYPLKDKLEKPGAYTEIVATMEVKNSQNKLFKIPNLVMILPFPWLLYSWNPQNRKSLLYVEDEKGNFINLYGDKFIPIEQLLR